MLAPGITSLAPIHDVGHSSSPDSAHSHVTLCKEWPSDNLPRFGGPKPTRPTDPEVAKNWPAGTCYFCHLNVKKGKEGYSIVHSLGGKVFCHKVCGAKARKVRQAQQLSGGSPCKEQAPGTPPAKRCYTPEPSSPTMAFPPYSPSKSFLPLKKRMAAAAAAAGWNSQRSSLSSSVVKRERDWQSSTSDNQDRRDDNASPPAKSRRPDNLGTLEIPRTAEAMAGRVPESPQDGQSQDSTTDVAVREEPSTPVDPCARMGLTEPKIAASSEGLVNLEALEEGADHHPEGDWVQRRESPRGSGISKVEASASGPADAAAESPEPHQQVPSEGHGIRSKRKPAKRKWGNIAGMLKLGESGEP